MARNINIQQIVTNVTIIIFNVCQNYVLVKVLDDKYDVIEFEIKNKKYDPVISAISESFTILNEKITCWELVTSIYNEINNTDTNVYTVVANLEQIKISEEYDIIHIDDINNVDCTKRLKWLIYLCLDVNFRNKKII
jgi:hypothetical protein